MGTQTSTDQNPTSNVSARRVARLPRRQVSGLSDCSLRANRLRCQNQLQTLAVGLPYLAGAASCLPHRLVSRRPIYRNSLKSYPGGYTDPSEQTRSNHFRDSSMATEAEPVSRPWRRFLRFSVRGMIVVVLLVGGWLGWLVRSARIQREAVAAIQQAGGSVYYDWEWRSGQYLEGTEPPAPRWVVERLGFDYFGNVAEMCNGNARGDAVLAKVGELHALETLNLEWSHATDAGLACVIGLRRLKQLFISDTNVTDAGLLSLQRLEKLEELDLTNTRITDDGLVHLTALTSLRNLYLENDDVTDNGLMHLKKLTGLETLGLRGTKVTDGALVHLREMKGLKQLLLDEASVNDAAVRELQRALPKAEIARWPTDHIQKAADAGRPGFEWMGK